MKSRLRWGMITGAVLAGLYTAGAAAQTITVADVQGQAGTTVVVPVTFQQGAGNAAGYQATLTYDTAAFGLPTAGAGGAATCTVNDGTGEISVFRFTLPAAVLSDEVACNLNFPIEAATALGVYPIAHVPADAQYSDTGGTQFPATAVDGSVEVIDAPPDVTLSFNPAPPGPVTFPGGVSGTTVNQSITVNAAGNAGSGTVTGCSISGAGASAFAVTSGDLSIAAGGSDTIDLTCDLGNDASTATLTCTETDSNSAGTPVNWTLNCAAGTPVPAPEFDSTPAPGGTINCSGTPESVQNRTLTIENIGDLPLTVSDCSTADAGFSVTGPTFPQVIAAGGSIDVGIQCTVPADGLPAITGDLTCTSDDANEGTVTYGLIAGPVTVPPANPAPELIPANSLWSLLALFGVIAGIGAVVVGVRRH